MRQIVPFSDQRLGGRCVHCGDLPGTRDHVPPRAFLDPPYPEALAVVPACAPCNQQASADEQYITCALEVAVCGSSDPSDLERDSVARALQHSPGLRARLVAHYDGTALAVEPDRVTRVLTKAARGLWAYETSAADVDADIKVDWWPMVEDFVDRTDAFVRLAPLDLLPEVGSRLMFRMFEDWQMGNEWQVVQPDRFQYAVETGSGGERVKMILRNYLAVETTIQP